MNLLEVTVNELMKKFGAGNHKPGSGSAAAFQGMVSAKLISTVISLTLEKPAYTMYSTELITFQERIEKNIYPTLTHLFIEDSKQFDKTIKLRIARDKENDEATQNKLRREALEELKISIEIPFEIAELCAEIADISSYVFDKGFKSARGDSQVGLSGAVSAIAGCIAIIRLNVLSFNSSEYNYCKSIIDKVNKLNIKYKTLAVLADEKIKVLEKEFETKIPLFESINDLLLKYKGRENVNIEQCTKDLQNLVWKHHKLIWKKTPPKEEKDILSPDSILKTVLGYDYFNSGRYGIPLENNHEVEIAGIIDQPKKIVAVSNSYPKEVQRFTAAHELGHAILHKQSILHRDIPADSSANKRKREQVEIEADKFATYFLMPSKLIKKEFYKIFNTHIFEINEDNAFKFSGRSSSDLRKECNNLRALSRKLAKTEFYNNNSYNSLFKQFNVSVEAMAIRLEELELVKY
ncbi:ImmA/IrrE family metallo-endopeptidase [Flavobacterium alkalisoli]|uniref:ImmA/IrrE family metallo-endopeptidase n=1 Tax=Flavobacterium alkalisoli TaxID=2602769 RepID=A0A5B9FTR8_9FLAO|nr:cyclodeaminase/cyclohydrolase family protein [Flavobacterium alkalisoli]QEE50753.1 ImmA/IrrE family metallo-endopeptidase [Flavobacterium alkalisoli]